MVMSMYLPQLIAGIGVTLLLTHVGLIGGWASPTLAQLMKPDSPISISLKQASWVASFVNLGRFFGGILGPLAASHYGSRSSILATMLLIGLGWLLVALAHDAEWLCTARLCSGVGLGMAFSTFPLYIGEVARPRVRGALIALASVGAPFGQVVASICGSYLSVCLAGTIYAGLAALIVLLFIWLPESPHHLVRVGKREKARSSVSWYRAGREVDEELATIEKLVSVDHREGLLERLRQAMVSVPVRYALLQIVVLFAFMQLSGLNVIMFFMEYILQRARFQLMDPSVVVILVNIGSVLSAIASIFLIDVCGRKFLLLVSSAGTTLSMLGLTCYFWLLESMENTVSEIQWLPAFSIFLYMISFFVGLLPVPSAILSEIFPTDVKCVAASVAILTGAVTSFVSAKTYVLLIELVGDAYLFLIYAVLSAFIIPYTLFNITETKGKSLQQIQNEFARKSLTI